jgi:hypothetical protein
MIERILSSDLVVVDITTLNANVFYELGIRHTAQLSGTVLVHMANKPIPFNIGGMRVVEYECDTPEGIAHSQDILEANIRNSLTGSIRKTRKWKWPGCMTIRFPPVSGISGPNELLPVR